MIDQNNALSILYIYFIILQGEDFEIDKGSIISKMEIHMINERNNIVAIVGSHGGGRRTIASTLSQNLIASYHWSEAFFIDLDGVYSTRVAGLDYMTTLLVVMNKIHNSWQCWCFLL